MTSDPRHCVLLPVGSHGDVHPAIGMGIRLAERGHRVTVITNDHFQSLVVAAGLEFVAAGTSEQYHQITQDPDLWHARRAFHAVTRNLTDLARLAYQAILPLHAQSGDRMVMVGSSLAFGARMAQEKFDIPLATLHLSPAVLQSVYETPRLPAVPPLGWAPKWLRHGFFALANRVIDNAIGPALNAFRAELSLPAVHGIFKHWWHSPQLVLAMFPDWYAAVQPDWPPQTLNVGFPLYDERGVTPLPPSLEAFLHDGPPPVAFTPGSAMFHADGFFAASAEACRLSGLRGVLLTRKSDQVPRSLPPGVINVDYAPFSELLPRCAAVVHHGGIGSAAQALAAGTPQLIQPFAHDQPDNAERLVRLGVARSVAPRRYKPRHVARLLQDLTSSPFVRRRAAEIADRLTHSDAIGRACNLVEQLANSPGRREAAA